MATLLAEDVLLLLLDDSGAFVAGDNRKLALAGAVLAELALIGAVEVETEKGLWKRSRVVVEDPSTVADPVLTEALDDIAAKKRSAQDLVNRLGKNLSDQLCARLVDHGLVRRVESKVFGLFPRTRWPVADSRYVQTLRASLRRALVDGEDPDQRTACVIAVLSAIDVVPQVVDRGPLSKRELNNRAKQIAEGNWASEAVRKALQATQAAMVAAVTASTVAATSGT
ncbi:MAG TPA: GPP34 family phosphoprotein [Sporichthya sp.]|nr:GPP34 family phosphoprotein [Sporichthya sp.]